MDQELTKGLFVTLEGGEAVGKSTQIQRLKELISSNGFDVVVTREPGGTPEAEAIRKELENPDLSEEEEAALFYKARESHITQVIQPALKEGKKIVICDRFVDSTHVYQGIIRDIGKEWLDRFDKQIEDHSVMPSITFVFDLPAKETVRRIQQRGGPQDHYDSQGLEFHEAVRQGFLAIASKQPDRCVVIDASESEDIITDLLLKKVMAVMKG